MGLRFTVRDRTYYCVSIVWVASVVSSEIIHLSNVTRDLKLEITPQVAAQCGLNVTLRCVASSSSEFAIKRFAWLKGPGGDLCTFTQDKLNGQHVCESKSEALNKEHSLTLTLTDMMPDQQGEYFCKLVSRFGLESKSTVVTLEECRGTVESSSNQSHVWCQFHGVYPVGTVHWTQGSNNLTDSATTQTEPDHHGLYNVKSTLHIESGDMNQPYSCSLWIPASMKHLISHKVEVRDRRLVHVQQQPPPTTTTTTSSSGSSVRLQWVCVMVGALMAKFIM